MRLLKALSNPFMLVAEGFVVGAILFASATPSLVERPAPSPAALDSTVIPNPSR